MFSFGCVKTVVSEGISHVNNVYKTVLNEVLWSDLLSFARVVLGFYYTFTSSFLMNLYSAGFGVLPSFHKPYNNEINLNNTFISTGAL